MNRKTFKGAFSQDLIRVQSRIPHCKHAIGTTRVLSILQHPSGSTDMVGPLAQFTGSPDGEGTWLTSFLP